MMPLSYTQRVKICRNFSTGLGKSKTSVAFGGCGWLTPFHIGVIKKLKEEKIITNKTLLSGTSGGALAALIALTDISCDEAFNHIVKMSIDKSFQKNINLGIKKVLRNMLPDDILTRCNGRLYICVTKVWPDPMKNPLILHHFDSKEHLIDVVAASCFIPVYSDSKKLFTTITASANLYIDGGALSPMPPIGDIRVSPITPLRMLNRPPPHIALDSKLYPLTKLLPWVMQPQPHNTLLDLYQQGYSRAGIWIGKQKTAHGHVSNKDSVNTIHNDFSSSKSNVVGNV